MNSGYGYDIQCEIVGETGTARLSDPDSVVTREQGRCSYSLYSDWSKRFSEAYDAELQEWISSLEEKYAIRSQRVGRVCCLYDGGCLGPRKDQRYG